MDGTSPQLSNSTRICWRGAWTLGLIKLNEELRQRMLHFLDHEMSDLYNSTEAKLRRESKDLEVDLVDLDISFQDTCKALQKDYLAPEDIGV